MTASLNVAHVQLFAPPAARLHVSQVKMQSPAPPTPGDVAVLHVAQVVMAVPVPLVPAVLQVSQVKFKAPRPEGEAPYSGALIAGNGNLHSISIRTAAGGQL